MNLSFQPLDLKLRHTFQIAREIRDVQNNIIVLLKDEDGISGLGEAAPTSFLEKMQGGVTKALTQSIDFLKGRPVSNGGYYPSTCEYISQRRRLHVRLLT